MRAYNPWPFLRREGRFPDSAFTDVNGVFMYPFAGVDSKKLPHLSVEA